MGRGRLFGNLCLGIGATFSGTYWLRTALAGHPDLSICPMGNVDYLYHRHLAQTRRDVEATGFSPPDCWEL